MLTTDSNVFLSGPDHPVRDKIMRKLSPITAIISQLRSECETLVLHCADIEAQLRMANDKIAELKEQIRTHQRLAEVR